MVHTVVQHHLPQCHCTSKGSCNSADNESGTITIPSIRSDTYVFSNNINMTITFPDIGIISCPCLKAHSCSPPTFTIMQENIFFKINTNEVPDGSCG